MLKNNTISFQGEYGANSHLACKNVYPEMEALPCHTFEDVFESVKSGKSSLAMIPIENSVAGRVADIHYLLPESGLFIIKEHFQKVNHCLLAKKGANLEDLQNVYSHIQALSQCRKNLHKLNLTSRVYADTAGAAKKISLGNKKSEGAIASEFASEIYKLKILIKNFEDEEHNTTRFVILSKNAKRPKLQSGNAITSFVFQVRNVPSALYKAMGGFATNNINMTKLESYQLKGSFTATQFYADVEGHLEDKNLKLAMEELKFYTSKLIILGVYSADRLREKI
ncbi:MAG: prephenate dehydratase [Rhodospirillaceae bacterium]|nr:prephenate dehydratase [Rhodospirillaceae bacterium]|tara:strand:- start:508 stop:1353 length:846 start_codon:yes stop_codon:yes gene_type:complete